MNELFNRIIGNAFFDAGDGGGNGGNAPIKFGGVEVDLAAEPEVLAAQIAKAQEAYVSSSNAGIKSAKELKEANAAFETFKKDNKNQKPLNQDIKSMITEMFKESMGEFNKVAAKGREINLNAGIKETDQALRKDFSMLGDDAYSEAMKEANELWNKQDSNTRNGEMYQNIARLSLGKELRKNSSVIKDEIAMETIMKNPELSKKFLEEYVKKTGVDINMPSGGFNNQESFTTQYQDKLKEFGAERDSQKRKDLAVEISTLRNTGKQFGFTYD